MNIPSNVFHQFSMGLSTPCQHPPSTPFPSAPKRPQSRVTMRGNAVTAFFFQKPPLTARKQGGRCLQSWSALLSSCGCLLGQWRGHAEWVPPDRQDPPRVERVFGTEKHPEVFECLRDVERHRVLGTCGHRVYVLRILAVSCGCLSQSVLSTRASSFLYPYGSTVQAHLHLRMHAVRRQSCL